MTYLYASIPFALGGMFWLAFTIIGKLLDDKKCAHVIYPDDPVCLKCGQNLTCTHKRIEGVSCHECHENISQWG